MPGKKASVPKKISGPRRKDKGFDSLKKFYLSLLLQNPKSKIATEFIKEYSITEAEIKAYKRKIKNK
jgi:hypothetical protein